MEYYCSNDSTTQRGEATTYRPTSRLASPLPTHFQGRDLEPRGLGITFLPLGINLEGNDI
jgi:hypothetical protein